VEEEEGAGRCFQIRGDYSTVETELLGIHRQNFGILTVSFVWGSSGVISDGIMENRSGDQVSWTYISVTTPV